MRSGEFAVDNPSRAAVAILDMVNGISWWLRPDHEVDDLVEQYVRFALDGILQTSRRMNESVASPPTIATHTTAQAR